MPEQRTTPVAAPVSGSAAPVSGPILIVGAGPAGLTAAYQLIVQGRALRVIEQGAQVGGIAGHSISAQGAAQRIKALSLCAAVTPMLFSRFQRSTQVKTLTDEFEYRRHGPGMMWERFRQEILRRGGAIDLECAARRI